MLKTVEPVLRGSERLKLSNTVGGDRDVPVSHARQRIRGPIQRSQVPPGSESKMICELGAVPRNALPWGTLESALRFLETVSVFRTLVASPIFNCAPVQWVARVGGTLVAGSDRSAPSGTIRGRGPATSAGTAEPEEAQRVD